MSSALRVFRRLTGSTVSKYFLVELSTLGVDHAQKLSAVLGVRDDDALPEEREGTSRDSGNRRSLGAVLERENAKLLPIEEREMPGAGGVGPPHEIPPGRSDAEGELSHDRKFRVSHHERSVRGAVELSLESAASLQVLRERANSRARGVEDVGLVLDDYQERDQELELPVASEVEGNE